MKSDLGRYKFLVFIFIPVYARKCDYFHRIISANLPASCGTKFANLHAIFHFNIKLMRALRFLSIISFSIFKHFSRHFTEILYIPFLILLQIFAFISQLVTYCVKICSIKKI